MSRSWPAESASRGAQRWLVAAACGFLLLLCFGWMQTLLGSYDLETFTTTRGFGHPVLALEFVTGPAEVDEILGEGPSRASRRADLVAVQRADVWFPVFYGAFLFAVAWALRREGGGRVSVLALACAVLAVVADYGENALIATLLEAAEGAVSELAADSPVYLGLAVAARLKFGLLGLYGVLVAVALRRHGMLGRFAALAGQASFLAMAAAIVFPARVLEPASAVLGLFWFALLLLAVREAVRAQRQQSEAQSG
ncbi:MAG: hypothetical protein DWQ36_18600 [Acidobacteria bacterium]|nr:MAG: hypothetical protein DWQ36_18600 [Acidobacteriota bacterium]